MTDEEIKINEENKVIDEEKNKEILILIEKLKKLEEENSDWNLCEDAMNQLIKIGEPAVELLLKEIQTNFENKKFHTYLFGSLSEIKDKRTYDFITEILNDYISDYKKYDSWFDIIPFILDLEKQEKKEPIPLLERLLKMNHLSIIKKREIKSTIEIIKDPWRFKKETEELMKNSKKIFEEFEKFEKLLNNKKPKIDSEDYLKRARTPDEDFEINFRCKKCNERQNLKTGYIWCFNNDTFVFDNEIMCRHCFSHDLKPSKFGERELLSKQIRIFTGKDKGILNVGKKVTVENKKMNFDEAEDYLLNRIKEEPLNGELYLRLANNLRKNNKYEEAIKNYEKSLELNQKLIASYLNLVEVYSYRHSYYNIIGAKEIAFEYFLEMLELFNSHDYNICTIMHEGYLLDFIAEKSEELGLKINFKKIGRNSPCPCGSGKKYKKCCLGKE